MMKVILRHLLFVCALCVFCYSVAAEEDVGSELPPTTKLILSDGMEQNTSDGNVVQASKEAGDQRGKTKETAGEPGVESTMSGAKGEGESQEEQKDEKQHQQEGSAKVRESEQEEQKGAGASAKEDEKNGRKKDETVSEPKKENSDEEMKEEGSSTQQKDEMKMEGTLENSHAPQGPPANVPESPSKDETGGSDSGVLTAPHITAPLVLVASAVAAVVVL